MQDLYLALAAFLVLNIAAGLVRVLRGPTPPDRMLAAQLFGTTGVAALLLLAEAQALPVLRDVALVFALLAALATVAFVRRVWYREDRLTNDSTQRRKDAEKNHELNDEKSPRTSAPPR